MEPLGILDPGGWALMEVTVQLFVEKRLGVEAKERVQGALRIDRRRRSPDDDNRRGRVDAVKVSSER